MSNYGRRWINFWESNDEYVFFSVATLGLWSGFQGVSSEEMKWIPSSPNISWPNDIVPRVGVLFLLVKIYGMKEVSQA